MRGILAIQVPMNQSEPLFEIIDETVRDAKWGFRESNAETNEVLSPVEYYDTLSDEFSVWETLYYHKAVSLYKTQHNGEIILNFRRFFFTVRRNK